MVNYWKSKVLPTIKKVFDRNGKKAAAAEACKSFDESKVHGVLLLLFFFFSLLLDLISTGSFVWFRRTSARSSKRRRLTCSPKLWRSTKLLLLKSRFIDLGLILMLFTDSVSNTYSLVQILALDDDRLWWRNRRGQDWRRNQLLWSSSSRN